MLTYWTFYMFKFCMSWSDLLCSCLWAILVMLVICYNVFWCCLLLVAEKLSYVFMKDLVLKLANLILANGSTSNTDHVSWWTILLNFPIFSRYLANSNMKSLGFCSHPLEIDILGTIIHQVSFCFDLMVNYFFYFFFWQVIKILLKAKGHNTDT